jgi:hypothetical protein
MIDKREILEQASALGLLPNIIEKDYILGWMLAGIDAHPALKATWVFKGGTCLKKCYFETYRFSEDLDFTLRDEGHLNEAFLRGALGEVIAWITDASGLSMPADQIGIDIYTNTRGRLSCQGRIGYRGPVSKKGPSPVWTWWKRPQLMHRPATRSAVLHTPRQVAPQKRRIGEKVTVEISHGLH